MMNNGKITPGYWLQSVLHSYSQVFYSLNQFFAGIILLVTFFNPRLGACGLAAVTLTNVMAYTLGFNRNAVHEGLFGFGALLLGLALGYEYEFNGPFVVIFMVALFMLLITTVLLMGFMNKHSLPVLSFPFLFVYWIVSVSTSSLSEIHLDQMHAYAANEAALQQDSAFYQLAHCLDGSTMHPLISSYFKTLSGTFFTDSILGGMLIAAGLLYFSRIAFSLSVIGFATAYGSYVLFGADTNDLTYHLMGSNFIFLAIGVGCFYIIPGIYSYLTVAVLTPVLMLIMLFSGKTLGVFHLKALTFPFSLLTTVFLYTMHQRWLPKFLHVVVIQYYSAEKTIYKYRTSLQRFKNAHLAKLSLPFWGEWKVSQGYGGGITHLGEWDKALDFVIEDYNGKTYREPGVSTTDYFCYDKPVVAPADGYVYDIVNTVEDNSISGVNTEQNWGNTIVLNHLNGLFSQLSHLKKDSFKVAIGEYVTRGTILATCGNSGRSPEPHIHFQLQTVPTVGAKTLSYPIAYFMQQEKEKIVLKNYEVPAEGAIISNVISSEAVKTAFDFTPGKKLTVQTGDGSIVKWEVFTDAYNRTYLHCHQSKAIAYFVQDGTMLYFTDFEGDRKSLLFTFYLAHYRLLMGAYENVDVFDKVPVIHFNHPAIKWLQDFFAPFYIFTKVNYRSVCSWVDNTHTPEHVKINSEIKADFGGMFTKYVAFETEIRDKKITGFKQITKKGVETYTCVY